MSNVTRLCVLTKTVSGREPQYLESWAKGLSGNIGSGLAIAAMVAFKNDYAALPTTIVRATSPFWDTELSSLESRSS